MLSPWSSAKYVALLTASIGCILDVDGYFEKYGIDLTTSYG